MNTPETTIIVPAYNEATVILRTLGQLAEQGGIESVRVIVAANGCRDETADLARSFRAPYRLEVLDLPVASKTSAINAAERLCAPGSRIYLDADLVLERGVVPALIRELSSAEPLLVSPGVKYDTSRSSAGVRMFYDVFRRLPHVAEQMTGGMYGVTPQGRQRFGQFPRATADDRYVKRRFAAHERRILRESFIVQTPRDLGSLIRIRRRIARGNRELTVLSNIEGSYGEAYASTRVATGRALLRLVKGEPALLPHAVAYTLVVAIARLTVGRKTGERWERDESTRMR